MRITEKYFSCHPTLALLSSFAQGPYLKTLCYRKEYELKLTVDLLLPHEPFLV